VWIINTGEIEPNVVQDQGIPAVGQARPAGAVEGAEQLAERQLRRFPRNLRGSGEVRERAFQHRAVVVIGAGHIHAGEPEQRLQRGQQRRDRFGVAEVVTGVDHQIRFQFGQ
jgi:hypothetical protein